MVLRVWHVVVLAIAAAVAGGLVLLGSIRSAGPESTVAPAPPPPAAPPAAEAPQPSVDLPVAESAEASLRNAVPAIEAYAIDYAGYTGMTLTALSAIDVAIAPDLVIVHADKTSYCIQIGESEAAAHYAGPGGDVAAGPCP
jgi:hypothetical protein